MEEAVKRKPFQVVIQKLKTDRTLVSFLLLIIVFIIGQFIMPGFANPSHIMTIVQTAFFMGLIALGETLVILSGNEGIDLSVGSVFTIGVVVGAAVLNGMDARIPLAVVAVLGTGFALGLVNGVGIAYLGIAPLIMTLGWGIAVDGIAYFSTGGFLPGMASPGWEVVCGKALSFGSGEGSFSIPWLVFIWVVIIAAAMFVLLKTKYGFMIYAIGANDRTAKFVGIKTKLIRMLVYGLSGAFAALSGLFMLGYVGTPNLGLGEKYVLPSVVAVIIGGVAIAGGEGTYLGAVIGSIFLTSILSILTTLGFGESGRQLILGFVLITLLFFYQRRSK